MNNSPESPIVIKVVTLAAACAALSACGGSPSGQSGGPINAPAPVPPTPPPPPPPPPPPTTTNFDTAEFRRSDGPGFHGAVSAWEEGFTGDGEIIAIIDTGLDTDSPEFVGRVNSNSTDIESNRGVDPEDDHGTNVALVAAGGRNDTGILGIAFDAEVLAVRADVVDSCGVDTPQDASLGCLFNDSAIADGIDLAVNSGAAVVNISLGGGAASRSVLDAVRRAANAGVVVVVSAGNSGDGTDPDIDPDQPDPFASSLQQAGNGNVIIVGSVDGNGDISGFANRAGDFASSYINARGEAICCVYDDGEIFVETINGDQFVTLFSGTSFAAPQVSGAVALLAQAFPNLTGQEIVEILLDTATDAGAVGVDEIFGTGILDIAAAIAPSGTTRVASTDNMLALADDVAIGSAAMGDALARTTLSTIVTDRYDRAYTYQLGSRSRNAAQVERLRGVVNRSGISVGTASDALSMAFTVAEGPRAGGLGWAQQLQLSSEDAQAARVLAARVAARIAPDTKLGFAISQSANGLVAQLQGTKRPAFRIAPQAGGDDGFFQSSEFALAARHQLGAWGLTVSADRGDAFLGANRQAGDVISGVKERRPTASIGFAADRNIAGVDTMVSLTWLQEDDTLLGGHFHDALGIQGADTLFFDAEAGHEFARSWRIGGAYRHGFTRPRGSALVGTGSQLQSQAWSFDVTRYGALTRGDSLGLRVSQPLRVSGGALLLDLPVAYDYATESAIFGRQRLSLSPEGREVMGELAWNGPLLFGRAGASLFYRRDPGHIANSQDDAGVVVSFSAEF